MIRICAITLVCALAACGQQKSSEHVADAPIVKPVAEPLSAAQTYFDGTNTAPWLALNDACKAEAAANNRGVNCAAYAEASKQADKLLRANPAGFVGVVVRLK